MSTAPTATDRLSATIAGWPSAMQAAFWMLIIGSLVTFTLVFARQISADVHVFEIVFFRSVFGLLFMAPWMLRRGVSSLRVTRRGIITLRGSLAFFGSAAFFYAAMKMPLADVTSIIFVRPIVAAIAAIIFLHEAVRLRRWSAIIFGMIGALIIVRPGFAELNIGVIFALVTVCTLTWNTISLKIITRTNASDALAIWHMVVMLPLGAAACLFIWTTPSWEQLGWMALIGIFEMLGQRAMSRGYKAADATVLMAFTFPRLPVAAFLGFALFGEVPEIWVWLGAGVIAVSSIYIAHRESIAGKSKS